MYARAMTETEPGAEEQRMARPARSGRSQNRPVARRFGKDSKSRGCTGLSLSYADGLPPVADADNSVQENHAENRGNEHKPASDQLPI